VEAVALAVVVELEVVQVRHQSGLVVIAQIATT
jgi:hypothetical protein